MKLRQVGIVGRTVGPDDQRTLDDIHHQTGDYLSVAVLDDLPRDERRGGRR